jgi:hypothetical protein
VQGARKVAFQQCIAALDGERQPLNGPTAERLLVIIDDNMYYRYAMVAEGAFAWEDRA